MSEQEKEAERGEGQGDTDGWAAYAAQATLEGVFERKHPKLSAPLQDAQALAQAYRDAAAEMMADPLFDLDSGHGLKPDNKWGKG